VQADLEQLARLDITPLDSPEPELAYLFKHIVTHEVTYESLPFATRAHLHEQLAAYLENVGAPVDMIAHHYGRSNHHAKQREYWLKAGNAAHAAFANEAALDYYERLRPLLSEPMELGEIHLKCAEAYFRLGHLAESRQHVNQALNFLGQPLPARKGQLLSRFLVQIIIQAWHRLSPARQPVNADVFQTPDLDEATQALIRAYDLLGYMDVLASQASLVDIYYNLRVLNLYESSRTRSPGLAYAFSKMGYTAGAIPVHALARDFLRRAQAALNIQDHPPSRALTLLFVGAYNIGIGKWTECERAYQQALEIFDRLGDGRNWAFSFAGLGFSAYFQGQFARCLNRGAELYKTAQASNNYEHQMWGLNFQATCLLKQGQTSQAAALLEKASPLLADITDSRLTELYYWGASAVTHLKHGHWKHAQDAAATCARLLALAPIPYFSSLEGYSDVAEVYLTLWEKEKSQVLYVKPHMEMNAKQACRALHLFARIYPIAKPRSLVWQGLCDWLDGKPGRARRAWQKSLAAAQKLAMPYDEAMAYYEIGRHATGGEREENLARAGDIFDRLGVLGFDVQSSGKDH
jgi:tetratricopeptide (TPR) repeat protein